MLYSVWLCKTAGWEGPAQVLDWSRLSCQSSQRPATERPPRNRLHRVHGPRHLAPGSLQRRPQPGAGVTPQHSHRWGGLAFFSSVFVLLYMCSSDNVSGLLHSLVLSSFLSADMQTCKDMVKSGVKLIDIWRELFLLCEWVWHGRDSC